MKPEVFPYQTGLSANTPQRVQQIRRDDDLVKVAKVTLHDIDYAIYHHLDKNIVLQISDNGSMVHVPIIFAMGEKWSQIRQHGYLRDANKKIMAPLCTIRRLDVTNDERISLAPGQTWGGNSTFYPSTKVIPYKTNGMQYDRKEGQFVTKTSYEFYLMDVPNYIRVNYELILWTDLQEQMNSLVQSIVPADNHIWGDYNKFRTTIQGVTSDNVNVPGEDRLIKTTIQLQTDGYLRAEYEYQVSKIQKAYSIKRVKFMEESTDNVLNEQVNRLNDPTDVDSEQHGLRRNIRS